MGSGLMEGVARSAKARSKLRPAVATVKRHSPKIQFCLAVGLNGAQRSVR